MIVNNDRATFLCCGALSSYQVGRLVGAIQFLSHYRRVSPSNLSRLRDDKRPRLHLIDPRTARCRSIRWRRAICLPMTSSWLLPSPLKCQSAPNHFKWSQVAANKFYIFSRKPRTSPRGVSGPNIPTFFTKPIPHEHGTVCQPILEHHIRLCAPSSVISRPTCFSSSLRCCWQVGSAPFVRRRCDCLASSAPFTSIQTSYLLTYLLTYPK